MGPPTESPPKIGLALSGGTAKVIAHIGVLQAFAEHDMAPDVLVGTSGGSLIAVLWASGKTVDEMIVMAREINWRRLARIRIPRLGLFSNQGVANLVRDSVGDLNFEDLDIPTHVVTTDLLSGKKTVFSSGPIAPAVQASCSIPQIFAPVEIDGGMYADGGFVEYLPVETLLELGCNTNIGVHLGAYADFSTPPKHLIEMVMRTIGIVAIRNAEVSSRLADIVVKPDLRGFASFDLSRAEELVQRGYEAGLEGVASVNALAETVENDRSWWERLRSRWLRSRSGSRETSPVETADPPQ
jgi:NTE family protein